MIRAAIAHLPAHIILWLLNGKDTLRNYVIPTLDRWSRIGQPRQRCLSEQDAAGALRRAVAGAAPSARRTVGGPAWRRRGQLLRALTPAPLPLEERRPSPPSPLPLGLRADRKHVRQPRFASSERHRLGVAFPLSTCGGEGDRG